MTARLPEQSAGDDAQASSAEPVRANRWRAFVAVAAVLGVLAGAGIAFGVYQLIQPPAPEATYAVAFDGRTTLAVVAAGGSLQLENVSTGQLTASLVPLTNSVFGQLSVAFSPDGRMVGVEYKYGRTSVWDTATGRSIATFPDPPADANALAFSHDDRTLAVSAANGSTYLWNIATRHQIAMLAGPAGIEFVSALAFSPDDSTLGMTADNDSTSLWDVATRHLVATIVAGADELAFGPGGATFATADDTGFGGMNLWSLGSHQKIASFDAAEGRALAFSPDGAALATGSQSGRAVLWDVKTHQQIATFTDTTAGPAHEITSVAFSPDGQTIAVGDFKGHVYLWHVHEPTS